MHDLEFADIDHLQHKMRQVIERFGQGRWRLREDVLDAAYALVVDRIITGLTAGRSRRPDDLEAYASEVLRNLVRSGPNRVPLDRRRSETLPESMTEQMQPPVAADEGDAIPEGALDQSALTTAELAAVRAVRGAPSMASAAAQVHMSRRDFRVRLSRAAKKIRQVIEDQDHSDDQEHS